MQPAAAEIERQAVSVRDRPGPAAEPRPRLDNETGNSGLAEPPSRGNAGGAAANDCDLGLGHHSSAILE